MRIQFAQLGAAAILASTALAMPTGPDPSVAAAQPSNQVAIVMGDFYLNPSSITVKANEPIEFVTPNVGAERHRVSVQMVGTQDRVNFETTNPGEVTTYDMAFAQPGTYEIWCSFTSGGVNHRDAGMLGTLTVVS